MKTKLVAAFCVCFSPFLITNCGNTERNEDKETADESAVASSTFEVDNTFRHQLTSVFGAYLDLKDSFVDSDAAKAQQKAQELLTSLEKTDMSLLSGEAHDEWMIYYNDMLDAVNVIRASSALEDQRVAFHRLTTGLYKSINAFGLHETTAYYTYCPMAFDNEGGYWLSDNETIRNPYFGEQMLTCGKVTSVLN